MGRHRQSAGARDRTDSFHSPAAGRGYMASMAPRDRDLVKLHHQCTAWEPATNKSSVSTHKRTHTDTCMLLLLLLHPFNGLSSRTTWVSQHQNGKPFWILMKQEMMRWHQLDHMQIICTSLQTDNHASTSPLSFYGPDARNAANKQRQSTEGPIYVHLDKYC